MFTHFDPRDLLQAKYVVLYMFLASALFVHYRGQVRHKFTRQLTDHSTLLAPVNALIYLFSRVPATPYLKVEDFPQMKTLTDNWEIIREEGMKLLDEGKVGVSTGYNDLGFISFFKSGWKRFYLKWYDKPLPSAAQLCPRTVELLKQVPDVHGAMFTLLPPGSKLVKHRDPYAGSLRYHLGLRTPNNDACFIEVDGIQRGWRDGQAMMFDETYIHYAENKTDVNRLILFCDVERPMTNRVATALNRLFINHVMKITATQNMEGEPVGFANRVFAPVYKYRLLNKRFKKWNRKAYYTYKYAATAAILALIFLR
jgi:beta-hydroxylase